MFWGKKILTSIFMKWLNLSSRDLFWALKNGKNHIENVTVCTL